MIVGTNCCACSNFPSFFVDCWC